MQVPGNGFWPKMPTLRIKPNQNRLPSSMEMPLEDIISGCRHGNMAVQKLLYKRYYSLFMVMCLRYVPVREDAEEVLNNAFLRIFRYINKFNYMGSFEGWMKRIVVNCCLDFVKRQQQQHGRLFSLHNDQSDLVADVPDSNLTDEKYDKAYLLELLQALPDNARLVFNLYVFEEYSHREIGDALNMAERTSQAHLAKARQLLAKQLDKKKLVHKLQRV
jgi:RNA polymerase sigma factor (sigma-70 family)